MPEAFSSDCLAAPRLLTAFEHLMVADARRGHPMLFFFELEVEGPLSLARLRAAAETAATRHPLLCSRLGWCRGRPSWLPPDVRPVVETGSADAWRPIDLTRDSGVRIVVTSSPPQTNTASRDDVPRHRLVLVAHHATLDGVAAAEFLGDLWARYAGRQPPSFKPGRAGLRPGSSTSAADPSKASPPTSGTWTFATFRPAPLARRRFSEPVVASNGPCGPPQCPAPPFQTWTFGREQTSRLRTVASARGCSLNDLIIAAAMRAAGSWNQRAGRDAGNVRITMPVNLRPVGSRSPAGNDIGYAFLDRTQADCADRWRLATGVAEASRWVVQNSAAAEFLQASGRLARRPWLLRLATRMPICFSTAVVSMIGDPSRRMRSGVPHVDGCDAPDDLVIRTFHAVPPLRPGTRAAIAAVTYAGDLSLSCLCSADSTGRTSRAAAREFLTVVAEELLGFA
ncbi:MAG: hypothetical protein FJ284_16240 [Planctomycetes bacterium]|nr:hypothetical protein [Planctomycetota bacterium]